jgi:pimeloyl-ACP methyl ester carboxylesterase
MSSGVSDHAVRSGRLRWESARVAGRTMNFGVAGDGPPVIFLHGWGLATHSYARGLEGLADQGFRVYAPALPGFGGSGELPGNRHTLIHFAEWVAEFIESRRICDPVTLVGHSFGGGVAIQTAHDAHPGIVGRIVLVNSIGGGTWAEHHGVPVPLRDRPLWHWGLHLQADVLPNPAKVLPHVLRDVLPNVVRNPFALWRSANLARTADLTAELDRLRRRELPVDVIWSEHDTVIPRPALESLCRALGDPARLTVPGKHSWLIGDPDRFAQVVAAVLAQNVHYGQMPQEQGFQEPSSSASTAA